MYYYELHMFGKVKLSMDGYQIRNRVAHIFFNAGKCVAEDDFGIRLTL